MAIVTIQSELYPALSMDYDDQTGNPVDFHLDPAHSANVVDFSGIGNLPNKQSAMLMGVLLSLLEPCRGKVQNLNFPVAIVSAVEDVFGESGATERSSGQAGGNGLPVTEIQNYQKERVVFFRVFDSVIDLSKAVAATDD